jgi:AraC family transcriptional regulator
VGTTAKVKIEHRKPLTLAYIEHRGDYGRIPFDEYIGRLYAWTKERRVRPGMQAMGIFYDSPERTPPAQCRCEIGIPVYGDVKPEGDVRVKAMPAMDVATISHRGPSREYSATYRALSEWIALHGYEWVGPSFEVYSKKPTIEKGETILYAKVMAPVRKK